MGDGDGSGREMGLGLEMGWGGRWVLVIILDNTVGY